MNQSGGKRGLVISIRPGKYPRLPQQNLLIQANQCCNIKKGIKRKELLNKMHNCIPEFYKLHKEGKSVQEIDKILNIAHNRFNNTSI